MAVYHLTIHAHGDWRPDHPRGYTRRGKGYQPPDPEEAHKRDERAKQEPTEFPHEVQALLIRTTHDFCVRRRFRLLGIGNERGHTHIVIGWKTFCAWHEVLRRLKNILTAALNRHFATPGRHWFGRGGSRTRGTTPAHLTHLLHTYLPDHSGLFWGEGMPVP